MASRLGGNACHALGRSLCFVAALVSALLVLCYVEADTASASTPSPGEATLASTFRAVPATRCPWLLRNEDIYGDVLGDLDPISAPLSACSGLSTSGMAPGSGGQCYLATSDFQTAATMSNGEPKFDIVLDRSWDLQHWSPIVILQSGDGSSAATVRAIPGTSGYFMAFEYSPNPPTSDPGQFENNLSIRYYPSLTALQQNAYPSYFNVRSHILPATSAGIFSAQGTPAFRTISWNGSLANSVIQLGFHYLDNTGSGSRWRDLEALGAITGFTSWNGGSSTASDSKTNSTLDSLGFHGGHGQVRWLSFDGHVSQAVRGEHTRYQSRELRGLAFRTRRHRRRDFPPAHDRRHLVYRKPRLQSAAQSNWVRSGSGRDRLRFR